LNLGKPVEIVIAELAARVVRAVVVYLAADIVGICLVLVVEFGVARAGIKCLIFPFDYSFNKQHSQLFFVLLPFQFVKFLWHHKVNVSSIK